MNVYLNDFIKILIEIKNVGLYNKKNIEGW